MRAAWCGTPPERRHLLQKGDSMKRPFARALGLAAAVLLLSLGTAAAAPEEKQEKSEPFKRLTVQEVKKLISDPSVHVYDGNPDDLYLKSHIPGAVHLFSKDIKEGALPADKGAMLVFYCHDVR